VGSGQREHREGPPWGDPVHPWRLPDLGEPDRAIRTGDDAAPRIGRGGGGGNPAGPPAMVIRPILSLAPLIPTMVHQTAPSGPLARSIGTPFCGWGSERTWSVTSAMNNRTLIGSECEIPPPAPTRSSGTHPLAARAVDAIKSVAEPVPESTGGVKVAVTPGGSPATERATGDWKPPKDVSPTVSEKL